MKNLHNIFSDWEKKQAEVLEQHGINIELGYYSFWIEENDLYWKLKPYFDKWGVKDSVVSKFSHEEESAAEWLSLLSPWANGYPMPDSDNGYQHLTYDTSEYCSACGIGLKQKEPFRIKKAPNWTGNRKMFSLNWVFDEFFVERSFYKTVFEPIGIESRQLLLFRKETAIEDTLQLIIPLAEAPLKLEGYPYQVCKVCSRKRYDLITKGFAPSFKENKASSQIFKSTEWFGTGSSARKYIFISQELRKEFLKAKINATYIPCEIDNNHYNTA